MWVSSHYSQTFLKAYREVERNAVGGKGRMREEKKIRSDGWEILRNTAWNFAINLVFYMYMKTYT